MAALVQSFPQQSSTITMLQTRPASDPFQTNSQSQQQLRNAQMARTLYVGNNGITSYRGHSSVPSAAPYAFATVPILQNGGNPLRQHPTTPHLRQENRANSAPVGSFLQQTGHSAQTRQQQLNHIPGSVPVTVSSDYTKYPSASKDDSAISNPPRTTAPRPLSAMELGVSDTTFNAMKNVTNKPSPDRYRRNHQRAQTSQPAFSSPQAGGSAMPSGSGMATVGHLYNQPAHSVSQSAQLQQTYRGSSMSHSYENIASPDFRPRLVSKDDLALSQVSSSEQAKRYRRRSVGGFDVGDAAPQFTVAREQVLPSGPAKTYASVASSPYVPEKQDAKPLLPIAASMQAPVANSSIGSDDSSVTARSTPAASPSKREPVGVAPSSPSVLQGMPVAKHEAKLVSIPPRGSSDVNKRITNPSPLSKPMAPNVESSPSKNTPSAPQKLTSPPQPPTTTAPTAPTTTQPESPAAQHLAALNKKEGKKEGKSSRLRRAFSFGSAAELRKATAENNHSNQVAERARLRKERYQDEQQAEEAAIVQKQEAGGLGEGIYSGQGQFFTGSTDNLSISSTASSASIMLRKMGKGVKKSTRSLVGLFRPKSVIGVPAADAALPGPSLAEVSRVTVEAEREKVNVNANPHDQVGGGTGYPRLERNSLDAGTLAGNEISPPRNNRTDETTHRRSIVGGEKERAEVLATIKKGILKRNDSGTYSPLHKPNDAKYADFSLPQIPHINDSPSSSAPSTPGDDQPTRNGHRRTDSVTIEGEDYFMSVARFANSDAKSMPGTPRSMGIRNITFSPRIQFHDTWPSGEYDRRGEIATCNRLTPVLAQQIKEELNSFKMEMEVHEESKLNTHFF